MADYLKYCKFGELDFEDSFFDSLKKRLSEVYEMV